MATHSTVWTGIMSTSASSLAAGLAVVIAGDEFLPATAANRAAYGRAVGVAKTPADLVNRTFEYQVAGVLSAAMSGIADGAVDDWVIVASDGSLLRDATPDAGEDVIGRCPKTTGEVVIAPGVWDETNTLGGTVGATLPIDLTTDVTGTLPVANGGTGITSLGAGVATWLGTPSGANLAAALTTALPNTKGGTGQDSSAWTGLASVSAGVWSAAAVAAGILTFLATPSSANLRAAVTDETGTGALVFADTPSFTNPQLNDAVATSVTNNAGTIVLGGSGTGPGDGRAATTALRGDTINIFASSGGVGAGYIRLTTSGIAFGDSQNNNFMTLAIPDLAADRILNVPLLTGTDTLAVLGLAQTFSATQTFTAGVRTGSAPSTTVTGVGLSNNTAVSFRDVANAANIRALYCSNVDDIYLGDTTNSGQVNIQTSATIGYWAATHSFVTAAGASVASFTAAASSVAGTFAISGASLSIGTTPATTAYLRVPNNVTILAARNAANSANLTLLATNGSDELTVGGSGVTTTNYLADAHEFYTAGGAGPLAIITTGGQLALYGGSSATASAGLIRAPSNVTILAGRNAANSADHDIIAWDGSNNITFGNNAGNNVILRGNNAILNRADTITFESTSGGTEYARVGTGITAWLFSYPIGGNNNASAPFRWQQASITKSDATDLTLSAAQYECPVLYISGTPGGNFNVLGPNTAKTFFIVVNTTANTCTIKKSGGTGITVAASRTATAYHNGTDYVRLTADSVLT